MAVEHLGSAILVEISVVGKSHLHRYRQEHFNFLQCAINLITLYKFLVFFSLCMVGSANFDNGSERLEVLSSLNASQRSLDKVLQRYAFRAFIHPKTGIIYDAQMPNNVSGIKVDAVRLRSGSLRSRGILYNEFEIPTGIAVQPHVQRLVLVYQNLGNWSSLYYNSLGFKLVAPVLGLLAYNSSNFSSDRKQEVNIVARKKPMKIRFTDVDFPRGLTPMCILFYLNGTVSLTNVSSTNVCTTYYQGHFSLVVRSAAPAPAPSIEPVQFSGFAPAPSMEVPKSSHAAKAPKKHKSKTWKIALGVFLGGLLVLGLMGLLGFWLLKHRQKSRITKMEYQADQGEALQTALIGNSRAPTAPGARTQPLLENEYVT